MFRDHADVLAQDDEWLMSRFRLPGAILLEICEDWARLWKGGTARNHALPVSGFLQTWLTDLPIIPEPRRAGRMGRHNPYVPHKYMHFQCG